MKTTLAQVSAPNPSTPEAPRIAEVETWELGYGRGITGPTACQWHYMPGWSNDFQIVTLPNSASGNCNTVVAVIPKAQAKWMEYSRLIAAAPDMLAQLKKIRNWLIGNADILEKAAKTHERFQSVADEELANAKNYRATAKVVDATIAKAERGQ